MKKILISLVLFFFLASMGYAQQDIVGLSFFSTIGSGHSLSFGVTFDFIWISERIALSADWSVFNTKGAKNLIGWSFKFHLGKEKKLIVPIGFDFNNERFYIGLGANF